ncbi:MAG: MBOAT family protein [Lachnospiraceae bacterium]|nr:MBOAT family protein [Lachnospiraceae bacterium]
MVFSSIPFLYYFLPVALVLYFAAPKQFKNMILFLASLFFYAWGEPLNVIWMLLSILVGFCSGWMIEQHMGNGQAKLLLVLSIVIHVGFLVYFKCATVLPIGISFYTFQILSYEIDVYQGRVPAQRNLIRLGVYVAMFPQLIAGPIVRYADIDRALSERTHSVENFALGIRWFVIGLSKKILLANVLGRLCDIFLTSDDKSVLYYWLFGIAYSLQIYFDFSGYSDMTIGLGRILGFHLPENFNYPYIARSVTEFWRRWHISLGFWLRDYVYIPLGGNRVSKKRWVFNIFVVWILTGLWHGVAWNFIIWGLLFAVLLMLEKRWLLKYLEKSRILSHCYVLLSIIVSFVIFYGTNMSDLRNCLGGMIGLNRLPLISKEFLYYLRSYGVILLIGMIGTTPLIKILTGRLAQNSFGKRAVTILEPIVLIGLMLLNTAYLVDSSFNPFLYFRF